MDYNNYTQQQLNDAFVLTQRYSKKRYKKETEKRVLTLNQKCFYSHFFQHLWFSYLAFLNGLY